MHGSKAMFQVHGGDQVGPSMLGTQPTSSMTRAFGRLTPRQLEVLALMAEGRSNSAIARSLVISQKAVVQHTSQIYGRLDLAPDDGAHRRVLAVVQYLSHAVAA
jgi:DNA-binding NarL/FixJ family response regulator